MERGGDFKLRSKHPNQKKKKKTKKKKKKKKKRRGLKRDGHPSQHFEENKGA